MPSKSKKQHNLMAAAAHNPAFAKKVGIPVSVAKEFNQADKGRKFGSGGMAKNEMHSEKSEMKTDVAQDKKMIKKAFAMHDKQEHKGEHTNLSKLKKGGMAMKKMSKGGMPQGGMGPKTMSQDVEAGSNKLIAHGESAVQKRGHTKGKNLGDSGPIKGIMGGAKMMSKGGSASSRGDGIAQKGKTKGKMC